MDGVKEDAVPKHIGIVAVSPEGSSACYRLIGRRASEVKPTDDRPRVSLHNLPFSSYVEAIRRDDWPAVAEMIVRSATVLRDAGADFCVLPDNVMHHALPMAQAVAPLPFINMIELVADAVQAAGCDTVGLIGTKYVMSGSTYQTVLGLRKIKVMVPEPTEAEMIDRVIFTEAIYGSVKPSSRQGVMGAINHLAERGAQAVILGASEANALINGGPMPTPVIDPVALLADAAVEHAVHEREVA
jgi:aspartate racemase